MRDKTSRYGALSALVLWACVFACLVASVALALPSAVSSYYLVFDEPFDGTSIHDTMFGYQWTGYEGVRSVDQAVSVGGGCLTLTSFSTNEGGVLKHWGGTVATENYDGDNRYWTYGYFEARISLSGARGNLMAYWLESNAMFAATPQPAFAGNEVDIIEHTTIGNNTTDISNVDHMAIHWGGYGSGHHEVQETATIPGLNTGFHTFGLLWTPTEYKFYVDDVLRKTLTPSPSLPFMSNGPAFIVLDTDPCGCFNTAVLASGYGSLATSTTKMVVDYVRVYHVEPPPSLSISAPSSSAASTGPVTYTVSYTNATAVTLGASNITLNKTGTANGSVSVSGTGAASRTVTLSGITGNGTLGISVAARSASNAVGEAPAAGPSATLAADNVRPTTTSTPGGGIYNSPQTVTLTASEPATIYYTTNGSVPSTASPRYSGGIPISVSTTLRFFAVDTAGGAETAKIERYTILGDDGSIAQTKMLAEGAAVALGGKDLYFRRVEGDSTYGYIEEPQRSAGIRVEGPVAASQGQRVCLIGNLCRPAGDEPYIQVTRMTAVGSATAKPVGASNRAAAMSSMDGIYATIWGRVTPGTITSNSYVVTDGSDGVGIRVVTQSAPTVTAGEFAVISGALGYDGGRAMYVVSGGPP